MVKRGLEKTRDGETGRRGDAETRSSWIIAASPCLPVSVSPRPPVSVSPRPRVRSYWSSPNQPRRSTHFVNSSTGETVKAAAMMISQSLNGKP